MEVISIDQVHHKKLLDVRLGHTSNRMKLILKAAADSAWFYYHLKYLDVYLSVIITFHLYIGNIWKQMKQFIWNLFIWGRNCEHVLNLQISRTICLIRCSMISSVFFFHIKGSNGLNFQKQMIYTRKKFKRKKTSLKQKVDDVSLACILRSCT